MKYNHSFRFTMSRLAMLLATGLATLPTAVVAQHRCGDTRHVVLNNTAVVSEGNEHLLELLTRHVSLSRLGLAAASVDSSPRVVVDGVALYGGVQRLVDIPVGHVESVTILRPRESTIRFGAQGHRGAIVVTTKSGRRRC